MDIQSPIDIASMEDIFSNKPCKLFHTPADKLTPSQIQKMSQFLFRLSAILQNDASNAMHHKSKIKFNNGNDFNIYKYKYCCGYLDKIKDFLDMAHEKYNTQMGEILGIR